MKKTDREDIYYEFEPHVSIKNFYGNGSAKCIERTAVVQNILAFLGIESYIAFSRLSVSNNVNANSNGYQEGHVINIIKHDNKLLAYDSKNMIRCMKNGKDSYLPALVELPEKSIRDVRKFTMESKDTAKIYNVEPSNSKTVRTYTLSK